MPVKQYENQSVFYEVMKIWWLSFLGSGYLYVMQHHRQNIAFSVFMSSIIMLSHAVILNMTAMVVALDP